MDYHNTYGKNMSLIAQTVTGLQKVEPVVSVM